MYSVNECSGLLPLNSVEVVMLLFFTGDLAKTVLSLLKVSTLGCMAMSVALPNQTALGGMLTLDV
jgi:hypothetical protein